MSFRICTVGCGWQARVAHGPSLAKIRSERPDVVLAGCCDIHESAALEFKDTFGFERHYTDMEKMLKAERPDAVILIAPVNVAANLAERIMEMGFPIMMEKPPGYNQEEVLRLIDTADRNNIIHQVAFNRRFSPMVKTLKQKLDAKYRPEQIQCITYDMYRINRRDEDFSSTAIHAIDAARFIVGSEYEHIRFHYQELPRFGPGVANIYMDCTFKSGAVGRLNFLPVTGALVERAEVFMDDNTFTLQLPAGSGGTDWFETFGFYDENVSFINHVLAGTSPESSLRSSLQSVSVADSIRLRQAEYIES